MAVIRKLAIISFINSATCAAMRQVTVHSSASVCDRVILRDRPRADCDPSYTVSDTVSIVAGCSGDDLPLLPSVSAQHSPWPRSVVYWKR